jgi:hypothetical protein
VFGIIVVVGDRRWPSAEDVVWPLAFTSPIVIWSAGAWILKGRRWAPIVWLAASIVMIVVGLLGVYTDVSAMRQEKMIDEDAMHLAAFAAMLLQWFVALALLAVAGVVRIFTRSSLPTRPR